MLGACALSHFRFVEYVDAFVIRSTPRPNGYATILVRHRMHIRITGSHPDICMYATIESGFVGTYIGCFSNIMGLLTFPRLEMPYEADTRLMITN